jgi:hypothetical protein
MHCEVTVISPPYLIWRDKGGRENTLTAQGIEAQWGDGGTGGGISLCAI